MTSFAVGTYGASSYNLNFRDGLIIMLLFNFLGNIPVAIFATFGPKFGMRQMVISRYSFGYYGAMLVGFLNATGSIGWAAINILFGGQVINSISSGMISEIIGILIIAL